MKRINSLLLGLLSIVLFSCNSNVIEGDAQVSPKANITTECVQFSKILGNVADELNSDTALLNHMQRYRDVTETRGSCKLLNEDKIKAEKINSLLIESSKRLLEQFKIKDIQDISDNDKVLLATLLYADYMDTHTIKTRGGGISGNHYVDCALDALGIGGIGDMAKHGLSKYVERYGTKALLKTVAKFAGKSVSAIGWGLAIYDFATCVW